MHGSRLRMSRNCIQVFCLANSKALKQYGAARLLCGIVNRPQQHPTTQTERIRQRHTEWIPEAGPTQEKHRRKRPVARGVTVGTLKRGPPLRVRGDRGQPTGAPPPPLS
eukprot:scaffold2620_cov125-Isochrysis_galbana.AAC.3